MSENISAVSGDGGIAIPVIRRPSKPHVAPEVSGTDATVTAFGGNVAATWRTQHDNSPLQNMAQGKDGRSPVIEPSTGHIYATGEKRTHAVLPPAQPNVVPTEVVSKPPPAPQKVIRQYVAQALLGTSAMVPHK